MKFDFTLKQFFTSANYGERYLTVCHKIVTRAHFTNVGNKKIVVINGIHICVTQNDSVEIISQNRLMRFAPLTGDVQVKTPIIDVAIDVSIFSNMLFYYAYGILKVRLRSLLV